MIKNFFINTVRNLRKQSAYILLNLSGLAIGLASFLFILMYVLHELSYDKFHNNYEIIYRVKVVGRMAGSELDQAVTCAPLAKTLMKDYPEISMATRVTRMGDWLLQFGENRFNEHGVLFVDSTFFNVFNFKLIKGDPRSALARPKSMILTEKYARKYFGSLDPIGQRIIVEADTILYTVTGVVKDVPDNSHLKFDILASMSSFPGMANSEFWVNNNFYTYFVVRDGISINNLEKKFGDMVTNYVGPQVKQILGISMEDFKKSGNDYGFRIEALKDIHLKGAPQYNLEPMGSPSTVYIFTVIGILVLVIAIINYVNLATARSVSRAREVGVRKVSGAHKSGLIFQFLGESVLISAVAGLIAIILLYVFIPYFNNLLGMDLTAGSLSPLASVLALTGLIILVGLTAGFYPAFVLASFNPVAVLRGSMNPGSISKNLRTIMVVLQFTVSICIIIGSMIVYRQLDHMTTKDIGFRKENLLILSRTDAFNGQYEAFREQVLKLPGVEGVGFSRAIPGTSFNYNTHFKDNDPEKNTYLLNSTNVSFDFPKTLGVQLAQGRFFSREFGTDSNAVMINEAAVRSLGLSNPIGENILIPSGPRQFQKLMIIGVMKDFNIESMHKAITPVIFYVLRKGGGDQYGTIRLTGKDIQGTINGIGKIWANFAPRQPFQYDFFSDRWEHLYLSELKTARIFVIFSFLTIFIAILGLFGLITYITNKRTKEIGIRKTYGASVLSVLGLISGEVMLLILISSVIASPLALFGAKYWLESFADKIRISPVIFIAAAFIAMTIGWLSISFQTIRAARRNPASAVRNE